MNAVELRIDRSTRPPGERERRHVQAFVWVFLGAAFFRMIFEQAGSTLTIFADQVTDLNVAGRFEMPASWLQSINPFFIVGVRPGFLGDLDAMGRAGSADVGEVRRGWRWPSAR